MKPLLTIDEVSRYLHLSRDTVYRLAQSGKMPASKVGNQWRFESHEISQWVQQNKNTRVQTTSKKRGAKK